MWVAVELSKLNFVLNSKKINRPTQIREENFYYYFINFALKKQ